MSTIGDRMDSIEDRDIDVRVKRRNRLFDEQLIPLAEAKVVQIVGKLGRSVGRGEGGTGRFVNFEAGGKLPSGQLTLPGIDPRGVRDLLSPAIGEGIVPKSDFFNSPESFDIILPNSTFAGSIVDQLVKHDMIIDPNDLSTINLRTSNGLTLNANDIASLSGMKDNVGIEISHLTFDRDGLLDGLSVQFDGDFGRADRSYNFDDGTVHHNSFFANPAAKDKGEGTKIFASQVRAYTYLGMNQIETTAGGNGTGEKKTKAGMNGYYTWGRLGYDGSISARDLSDEMVDALAEHYLSSLDIDRAEAATRDAFAETDIESNILDELTNARKEEMIDSEIETRSDYWRTQLEIADGVDFTERDRDTIWYEVADKIRDEVMDSSEYYEAVDRAFDEWKDESGGGRDSLREALDNNGISISDIFANENLRDAWQRYGQQWEGYFDLSDGSYSMQVLDGYLREKFKRGLNESLTFDGLLFEAMQRAGLSFTGAQDS